MFQRLRSGAAFPMKELPQEERCLSASRVLVRHFFQSKGKNVFVFLDQLNCTGVDIVWALRRRASTRCPLKWWRQGGATPDWSPRLDRPSTAAWVDVVSWAGWARFGFCKLNDVYCIAGKTPCILTVVCNDYLWCKGGAWPQRPCPVWPRPVSLAKIWNLGGCW